MSSHKSSHRSNPSLPALSRTPFSAAPKTSAPLYLANEVRELDRRLIEQHGIPGYSLMRNAGKFAFDTLLRRWPETESIHVLCGSGNNAGDGYVIARLAKESGFDVRVFSLCDTDKLKGDAKRAYQDAQALGIAAIPFDSLQFKAEPGNDCVIVDAMLGTGLNTAVKGVYAEAIESCNQSALPVLAIDIPSGLSADTGQVLGMSIKADVTVTFIGLKLGLFTGQGRHYAGEIFFDALSAPDAASHKLSVAAQALALGCLLNQLERRPAHAHKGHYGHALLIGGNHGYGGAVMMATKACLRMGPGLTSVATQAEYIPAFTGHCPEAMAKSVPHLNNLKPLTNKASHILIGPGLGQDAWAEQMLFAAIESGKPLVLDADALNLLPTHPEWLPENTAHWLMTPHPGEAARLLKCTTAEIEQDRLGSIRTLSQRYGCSVILKGSGTLICHNGKDVELCPYGNPGMASGGMGDVLSGLLIGLLAQNTIERKLAIALAVCLHACAADVLVEKQGECGLLASDLIPVARALLNRQTCPNE